ncbi:MAG: nucleotidyl transferase AbiEii/AbiGii toxin family protein [bacterium]|nr:nucleotidyl transferase AbiEii/AbiGii toxin family protein [bacterium]
MITQDAIQKLATKYQTTDTNVVREYFQHLFLSQLYKLEGSENILFKGGTALRVIYGSPRFSEDLDFSIFNVEPRRQTKFIEDIFARVLAEIERSGVTVELGGKPGPTMGGYYGDATFVLYDYPSVAVAINVSSRNGRIVRGEVDSVANDFVSTYNVFHLPQVELVEEKVFNALLKRKKPRDFYDLYFIMRKGFLSPGQKKRLNGVREEIAQAAREIDFVEELSEFLPRDQHAIIRDFRVNLSSELTRQLSGV